MIFIPSDKRIFECDCQQIANNHQPTAVHKKVYNIQRDRVGSYKKRKNRNAIIMSITSMLHRKRWFVKNSFGRKCHHPSSVYTSTTKCCCQSKCTPISCFIVPSVRLTCHKFIRHVCFDRHQVIIAVCNFWAAQGLHNAFTSFAG
jgi:hypothetical protein